MRVLVTRAAVDAPRTVEALAARGHDAVRAPVTEVRATGAAVPWARADALAATSHHAFAALDANVDRSLPVFAVGRRTAEAARAAGFRDLRVGTGDAAGLATLLHLTLPRPARLLYLAGRHRKPDLEAALDAAGCAVEVAETYAAEAVERWPDAVLDALRGGRVDAALHFSRRSADLALGLADAAGLGDALLGLRHACLSADAAAPLLERGAAAVAWTEHPDEDSLMAVLAAAPALR